MVWGSVFTVHCLAMPNTQQPNNTKPCMTNQLANSQSATFLFRSHELCEADTHTG